MHDLPPIVFDFGIIGILIVGIARFTSVRTARGGNLLAALALALAVAAVLLRDGLETWIVVLVATSIGSVAGLIVAKRVSMIQIPGLVAFQHGAGGVAAFLISFIELQRIDASGPSVAKVAGVVGAFIGAATFAGSVIASGKLFGKLRQQPTVLVGHNPFLLVLVAGSIGAGAFVVSGGPGVALPGTLVLIGLAAVFGWGIAIRVGGADMPVLISFLNASAGLAAAFCGVIIESQLLVAFGATVAASGSILTHMMCRAMNRSLLNVFKGLGSAPSSAAKRPGAEISQPAQSASAPEESASLMERAISSMREAKTAIIVPGYGMALGQAQFEVVRLARLLADRGAEVRFAVHPVAGRMPGHMNVLLAEAEASYEDLIEMDDANPRFKDTDVVLVVGACDVVNPAASTTEGTPISGMPILRAHEARQVVVCNLNEKAGYSGVPNQLYERPGVIMLFGEAKATVTALLEGMG